MAAGIVLTRSGTSNGASSPNTNALANTNTTGIYVLTGPGTSLTTLITGTSNQINVVNGDGVAGSPTLSLASNTVFPGNGAITVPLGTSSQYPSTPTDGMIRYNTTTSMFEFYQNGAWINFSTGVAGVSQIVAGTNVTISPTGGMGVVTINSTGTTYQLYNENPVSPAANTVTGQNAFAIGEDNTASGANSFAQGITSTASGSNSIALGNNALATHTGQVAFANGKFVLPGDAQGSEYIFRGQSATQFPMEIFLDGASQRLTLTNNSAMTFTAMAIARRTDVVGDYGAFRVTGLIKQDIGTGSCQIKGLTSTEIISRTQDNLNLVISADTTNGSLMVSVTGVANQEYNWVVRVSTVEEIG